MARKEEPEESSGYSWMDTYGDMVTLLLCFFVLLYSFSTLDAEKQRKLIDAFSGSYSAGEVSTFDVTSIRENPITEIDPMVNLQNRTEQSETANARQEEIDEIFDLLYEKIKAYIEENGMEGSLSVSRTDEAIYLRFKEVALFNPGKADILPENKPTLQHIMDIISLNLASISSVKIEGHTDDVPIHNAEFSDNWDLSVKRATNMLRLVLSTGIFDEEMLSAVGYGEYHPIATNDTAEGRGQNRRVDFVLLKAEAD